MNHDIIYEVSLLVIPNEKNHRLGYVTDTNRADLLTCWALNFLHGNISRFVLHRLCFFINFCNVHDTSITKHDYIQFLT